MLRVSVLELPATWGKPHLMLRSVAEHLARDEADLWLLPEAAITGYVSSQQDFDLTRFAEPIDGPTATECAALARRNRTHLVAPLVLKEGEAVFNAMSCFSPTGELLFTYKKRHPWFPETWATPGPDPLPLVTIGGLRVTIAICFDIHFLEEESSTKLEKADLLLFPSAWVDDAPEEPARPALLQHLARRFNLNIANANWGSGDVRIPGQGASGIYDRAGRQIGVSADLT